MIFWADQLTNEAVSLVRFFIYKHIQSFPISDKVDKITSWLS